MADEKTLMIIEKDTSGGELWGRVHFDDNLIVESACTVDELKKSMKQALIEFHNVKEDQIEFELAYDLTALFQEKNYLNLSAVADRLGINRSLMSQYAAGLKFPSVARAKEIQYVLRSIGNELRSVNLSLKGELLD